MTDHVLDRTHLPIREQAFSGAAGRTLDTSVPDWSIVAEVAPPAGAPNVLVVLIDDTGFGQASTFGGPIQTPTLDRLAAGGLRFNGMHTAALCSPTRASLLTGRNHHRVGFGSVGELPGPFPGYSAVLPRDCAPFPKILQENGYATSAFGKWHLTPSRQQGQAGPFDRWPNGWGFDYFWGFLGGESGQFDPVIYENQSVDRVYGGPEDRDFYLPDALTDRAIGWLHGVRAHQVDKPWLMYYATGAAHAPHHVTEEWSHKYAGQFDEGWDVYRERAFARQKELGVIPADAELTPRNPAFPAWDSLGAEEQRLYARQMEVFAAFQENADYNVGRLIDEIERMGELEDTLILYIWGDNGASLEGTLTGSFNEITMQNGVPLTSEQQLGLIQQHGGLETWGGPESSPHCSAAWAWAGNTPFQWGKQDASHLGGTRNPMVVHWPAKITDAGGLRTQFTHVNDLGPTILDVAGIPLPETVDGIPQAPMAGTSFAYAFDDADAAERHTTQYFEIYGNRGIYRDGWWASCMLPRIPWDATPATVRKFAPGLFDPDALEWELYDLTTDFSQAHNVAAQHPEKVRELAELWWAEAEANRVLPMLGGMSAFFGIVPPLREQTRWTYWGADVQNMPPGVMPPIMNRSYTITADVTVPSDGGDGVLVGAFDHLGGFSLFVQDGLLRHTYSFLGIDTYRQVSDRPVPAGRHSLQLDFEADSATMAPGGVITLRIDDEVVGTGRLERTVPIMFSFYAGLDIGRDNGEVVDMSYEHLAPFPFPGQIHRIDVDVRQPGVQERASLHHAETAGMHARHIES